MIPVYIALGIFFICGIYLLATWKKETPLDKPFKLAVILTSGITIGMFLCSLGGPVQTDAEYEQLMLYKPLIESCEDEAVRFDYYERVQEWNDRYLDWYRLENSLWLDWTISDNAFSNNVGLIEFDLRRG